MSKVLIVDDEPRSLYAMEMLLSEEPYEISFADCGHSALAQMQDDLPDVILLDVMMPDLTGYEVCQEVKAHNGWRHIPIILVTALDRKEDVVRGLDAGADEFLTKPVNGPELRARVRSMLRIKKQYDEIEESLRLREDMADMIVHDMRSPISALMLYTDMLSSVEAIDPRNRLLAGKIRVQAQRLDAFLADLLIMAKMRSNKLLLDRTNVEVPTLLQRALGYYEDAAKSRDIHLEMSVPDDVRAIPLDEKLMLRVFDNLVSNALKFSPSGGVITLRLEYLEERETSNEEMASIRIGVTDQGTGVPEADRERVFDEFEVVSAEDNEIQQVGLGLALCRKVVEAHGGRIWVEDNLPVGAAFLIEL